MTGFHPGEVHEGPPHRDVGSTLDAADDVAQLITNRESIRAAYEAQNEETK